MRSSNHKRQVVLSLFGLTPLRIGGTERYCRELSQALFKRGWQSVLGFEGQPHPVVSDYLQIPNVAIKSVPSLTNGGLKTLVEVRKLIRDCRPEIVHLHYTGFVTLFPWLAKLSGVGEVFLTNHASYPEGFQPRRTPQPKRMLYTLINAPLSGVVCPSEFGRRCLTATGILAERRYNAIYNGTHMTDLADVEQLSRRFRTRYQIPYNRVLITQVGQLTPDKGVHDLLAAFKLAAAKQSNLQLVLVGEGPSRHDYERTIAEWNLSDRVTLTGLIEDTASAGVFEACDIFSLVSRWEELFGFVLVEAMSRGKPVVATRAGGIPEVVVSGETGFLVDRGDVESMAKHFVDLAKSSDLQKSMGSAGHERVANFFDVTKNVMQVIHMYGIT